MLLAATIVMASIVVTINRLLWRRLYALASGRFSMNG
jgi:ABC-type anion transport system duplicated permease subunit